MALIPITARVRPAVSTKDAGGVETASTLWEPCSPHQASVMICYSSL
jgi:hypothetical protein